LTGASLFVFRRRLKTTLDDVKTGYQRVPGHPFTTAFFVLACVLIVASTFYNYPENSVIGLFIVIAGIPIYFVWRRRRFVNE
jgi:APA family basic amino acid/polyamine antiporter